MTLALLIQANFPKEYWTHASRHAITIWNRLPNPKLDWLTPMEVTYLELGHGDIDLRVFGCLAAVQIPKKVHRKLDFERNVGIYIGNSGNSPDLLILVPGGKVIKSQHVFLHEHLRGIDHEGVLVLPDKNCLPQIRELPTPEKWVGDLPQWEDVPQWKAERSHTENSQETQLPTIDSVINNTPDNESCTVTVNERNGSNNNESESSSFLQKWIQGDYTPHSPSNEIPYQGPNVPHLSSNVQKCLLATLISNNVGNDTPKNVKSALTNKMWKKSMEEEYNAHIKIGTWELVERKPDMNVIGSTWTYRVKRDEYGAPIKYKSRLCAQGFSQIPGIDYDTTFAPVVEISTIRLLLAYAASRYLKVYQADVPTAYLNANLDDKIFMKQPTGFTVQHINNAEMVCKRKKAIYGLKQSGRQWWSLLHWGYVR